MKTVPVLEDIGERTIRWRYLTSQTDTKQTYALHYVTVLIFCWLIVNLAAIATMRWTWWLRGLKLAIARRSEHSLIVQLLPAHCHVL